MMKEFTSQKEAQEHVSQASLSRNIVVHCGHLACQRDSTLQLLESTRIISCATYPFQDAKMGKKKKKKKQQEQKDQSSSSPKYTSGVYTVTLNDSVFFPEGGGQPADRGTLQFHHPSSEDHIELHVTDAQNINEICVLFCRAPLSTDPNQLSGLLLNQGNGDNGELKITQKVDWDRRFDLMTQHSAQHLVSAVALGEFGINTHTFSLGDEKLSYIDLIIDESWDKDYASDIFIKIEQKANEHIRNNLPMTPTWLDVDDPLFETKVRSRLLPEGIMGPIRLVEIANGDIDMNTCCGTHVKTLGQLQMIKFFRMEKVKPTIFRVYFAAAKRLMDVMNGMYNNQASLTSMLSCQEIEQVQRVTQLLEYKRNTTIEMKNLREKLCASQAKEIMERCQSNNHVAVVDVGEDMDMAYMTMLSNAVMEQISKEENILLFVGGSDSFLLVGTPQKIDENGKKIAELMEGRGGGKNGKYQGKAPKIRTALDDVEMFLKTL